MALRALACLLWIQLAGLPRVAFAQLGCNACAPGTEPSAAQSGTCSPCAAGRVSYGGTHACMDCHQGAVPNAEQSGCEQCAPGSYPLPPTNVSCTRCPPAQVSNLHTNGACHSCASGHVPSADQGYCTRCTAGEQPNAARTACERCPAGQVSMTTQFECHACHRGTVNNTEQAECNLCPPGTEAEGVVENASWLGTGFCRDCNPGLYSTHATQCESCPSGHVPSPQQSFCVQCVAGEQVSNPHLLLVTLT